MSNISGRAAGAGNAPRVLECVGADIARCEVGPPAAATAAVFPSWAPLNNAILLTEPGADEVAAATELRGVYADAGVDGLGVVGAQRRYRFGRPDEVHEIGRLQARHDNARHAGAPAAGASTARRGRPHIDRRGRPRRRRTGSRHRPRGAGNGTRLGGLGDGARRAGGGRRLEFPARAGLRDLRGRHRAGMAASGAGAKAGGTRACRCSRRGARTATLQSTRIGAAALPIAWF